MSFSSDEELSSDWIPYSERTEWKDVTPLEQDDGDYPVVAIAYSDKFLDVYNYFRAILSTNEKSLRALELSKDALALNPANYTVWQYRREILKALNLDLQTELDYLDYVIDNNPKNYQVWHHRMVIVEQLDDPSRELDLTETVLNMDAKNYHAWQHRQWVIKTFNLFDDELTFVDRLISEDIRNNSAWNQRFFVLKHYGFTPEVIDRELHYAMNRIRLVKNNESSWNFLRGVIKQSGESIDQFPDVINFAEELHIASVRSPFLIAFLIDLYEIQCLKETNKDRREELFNKVNELCESMCKEHDIIRRKYWQYIADRLRGKLETQQTS